MLVALVVAFAAVSDCVDILVITIIVRIYRAAASGTHGAEHAFACAIQGAPHILEFGAHSKARPGDQEKRWYGIGDHALHQAIGTGKWLA